MTTIRDLIAAGFDPDTEIFVRRNEDDDTVFTAFHEVRHADSPSGETIIVLNANDDYVVVADEDEDEIEWQHDEFGRDVHVGSTPTGDKPMFLQPFEG